MLSRTTYGLRITLVAIGVSVGMAACQATADSSASAAGAERSSGTQAGSLPVQPAMSPPATGAERPTADPALAIEDEDTSAEIPDAPALRTQSELYWTGEGPGDELQRFVVDQRHAEMLLVAAAVRPLPDGRNTAAAKCNQRDSFPGPKAIWGACGITTDNKKVVRQFFRAESRFPAQHFGCGRATLACGSRQWGYRHILDRHRREWENIAAYDNVNWREAADWGMWTALKHPSATNYRGANDTFGYWTPIYLKNKKTGETVKRADVVTVVARKTKNIITAFPTNVRNF